MASWLLSFSFGGSKPTLAVEMVRRFRHSEQRQFQMYWLDLDQTHGDQDWRDQLAPLFLALNFQVAAQAFACRWSGSG